MAFLTPVTGRRLTPLLLILLVAVLPFVATDYVLSVLVYAGIAALSAYGFNLLAGYTGLVSLGMACFVGIGAYTAAFLGMTHGLPVVVWLLVAIVFGFVVGLIVGTVAMRVSGHYLALITLGLVVLGQHLFSNLRSITGGVAGIDATDAWPKLAGATVDVAGNVFTREQVYFWVIWIVVVVVAVMMANIVDSRPGRALQAIRDRDQAAELLGVRLTFYKIMSFAIAGACAALSGAFLAAFQGFISPSDFSLMTSIECIAVVVVGGLGTRWGPVLGAVAMTSLPAVIQTISVSVDLPLVSRDAGGPSGVISVDSLNQLLYGVVIVVFLMAMPHGLAGLLERVGNVLASMKQRASARRTNPMRATNALDVETEKS